VYQVCVKNKKKHQKIENWYKINKNKTIGKKSLKITKNGRF
jgi:hypothetical protein